MKRTSFFSYHLKNPALALGIFFICVAVLSVSSSWAGAGYPQASISQSPPKTSASPSRTSQSPKASPAKELPVIDLDGYRKIVADHRGKPLLITFWATWCEPCRDEFPLVNELAKQFAPQGLVVIGVNKDDDAELNLVQRFIARNQPVFPSVRQKPRHEDEFNDGVDPRWRGVMPANFFYTADGQLAGFLVGGQPREVFEKMIRAILPPTH